MGGLCGRRKGCFALSTAKDYFAGIRESVYHSVYSVSERLVCFARAYGIKGYMSAYLLGDKDGIMH